MSSYSEYRAAFSHIMENWLQTGTLKIEHLLRAGEVVTLRHLRTYLRNPGLLQGTYVNDEGDDVGLTEEQYEELGGLIVIYELSPEPMGTRRPSRNLRLYPEDTLRLWDVPFQPSSKWVPNHIRYGDCHGILTITPRTRGTKRQQQQQQRK